MRITLAEAMGTCFGVQDAIDMALDPDFRDRLTVVGQLVHNPQVTERLQENGVRIIERDQIDSIQTEAVMITAHGASDGTKDDLAERGFQVYDASCPLVIRLHKLARMLERKGYWVVVVGRADHVEVKGVVGNLGPCTVVSGVDDLDGLAGRGRIGVVSQTTNRPEQVCEVIAAMQRLPGVEEVRYVDTICQPVKDRQQAIHGLLQAGIDTALVVGGYNSANTKKLQVILEQNGITAYHIEAPGQIDPEWLRTCEHLGVTAGTSTPQDVIESVVQHVRHLVHVPVQP
jgi:4-hydroxy-3-methylbut-2-enyl diphosphate reductase